MREKNEIGIQWLVVSGIMVTILLILLFSFSVKSSDKAETSYNTKMQNSVSEYAEKFNKQVAQIASANTAVARILTIDQEYDNAILLRNCLSGLRQSTNAYCTVAVEADGVGINDAGDVVSVKNSNYFRIASTSNGSEIVYTAEDGMTGEPAIVISAPIFLQERTAYLLCFYKASRFNDLFKHRSDYDGSTFYTLIAADGTVIAYEGEESEFQTQGIFWDTLDSSNQNAQARTRVKIQNKGTGTVTLTASGETRVLSYTYAGINDWSLIMGVNPDFVAKNYRAEWSYIRNMLITLITLLIVFAVAILLIVILSRYHNSQKNRELQEKADTDLLTGLNNKLATERKIKEYMAASSREMGLMFILDIDNFKKINDTMGHSFGDEVLRNLGKQIGSIFRISDIIGRTGGDEFTILLKNIKSEENAKKEAEKLTQFFSEFTVGEYVKYSATASIGAAIFPIDGENFEEMYKSADTALYKAKRRGKNQIAFFRDEEPEEQAPVE